MSRRSLTRRTSVVIVSLAATLVLRWALGPLLGQNSPLVLLLLPVLVSAGYGGFWPGVAATLLGVTVGSYLFILPKADVPTNWPWWVARSAPYVAVGTLISLFADRMNAARRSLAEVRRRTDSALIAGDIGTYDWDVTADSVSGDRNFAAMFGLPPDTSLSLREWAETIHADDRPRVRERLERAREAGEGFEAECRVRAEGRPRWVLSRGRFEYGPDGRARRMLGTVTDVTDRKRAEDEMRRIARQHDALIDLQRSVTRAGGRGGGGESAMLEGAIERALAVLPNADGAAVELLRDSADADGELHYQAVAGLLGGHAGVRVRRRGSLSGQCVDAGVPLVCEDAETDARVDREACRRTGVRSMLVVPLPRGGRVAGVLKFANARPGAFAEADVLAAQLAAGAIANGLSTAAEAKAVEALRRSEGQFRTIADAMPQFVWVTRPDGYHEYFNRQWYEYVGARDGQSDGGRWAEPLHPDDAERSRVRWRHALGTGEPYEIEYRIRRHDGVYRWFLGRALAVRDGTGRVVNWYGTCTDIDEQKRLQQQYDALLDSERQARTQAEQAGRAKDEFLATISHELRTPLTAIVGWSHLLSPESDKGTLGEGLDVIFRNAQSQSRLIEDILDMSRITSGRMRLHPTRTTLRGPIEAAVATVRTAADAKGVRLVLDLGPDVTLTADADRLQQVFWNLLANAIKFTDRGGRVTVRQRRRGDVVAVDVADTGHGIEAEFLPCVFDRFRQADMTTTRRHGGLGLGLAIVRSLIELHGGRVTVTSDGVGRGSTFGVELPAGVAPDDGAARRPDVAEPVTAGRPVLTGRRVLIVDDEPDTRRILQAVVERFGGQGVTAAHVPAAIGLLRDDPAFDAVLSDIGMADEDGYVFIRRLRGGDAGDAAARLLAVALTAYTRPSDRTAVLSAGFDRYVAKPVNPDELAAALAAALSERVHT